ncbi:MAG: prolyl oligopeptidase family serine peptidase [Acidobacteriia bacterium]|nr:prolyl oligopeptidase family serine peptidase [Terriglobia bacterium]
MNRWSRLSLVLMAAMALAFGAIQPVAAQKKPTIDQFMCPAYPFGLVSAAKVDRLAWLAYDQGKRNVYTAVAPAFRPVRLTSFLNDDGTDISDLSISADGSIVVFVRGSGPNREGWIANPTSDPGGAERAIWAARTAAPGIAWRLAEGASPQLSPDGRSVLYVKEGQIYRARATQTPPASKMDKGEEPFIKAWGTNGNPRWSPDGTKIAFVSSRVDHSLIGLYDIRTRAVNFIAPSVDRDTSPTWSRDGKQITFIRRPGLPFGQQAQQGGGGLGLPNGPAYVPGTAAQGRGAGRGRMGEPPAPTLIPPQNQPGAQRGQASGGQTGVSPAAMQVPGLTRATFRGGYTLSFWVADPATCDAKEVWHTTPDERVFTNINSIQWAGGHVIFPMSNLQGDEWERYFSVSLSGSLTSKPVLLTTTDGLIEGATDVALSKDGNTLYYCTNAQDIERRHIWTVPTSGGTPRQVTLGEGIETSPVPLASGKQLAVLSADAKRPQSVGLFPSGGGKQQQVIFPILPKEFPIDAEAVPELVLLKSPDGLEIHDQLFLPKNLQPGEKRPAMIFVHGGPVRQMLLGYHYMHFYHIAYAVNQWLASQGYVVLSVNYRSGIGYGRSFRNAPNTAGRGNSEYQDVLAAGKYLQSRPDVDPKRVGIWGLSYGGLLTAQALARNSDIFSAGVDLAGVHLYGSSLDPADVSYQSSAIAAIDKWKSPVLLIHGDDDRNVAFQQTTGLVQLLRARDVYFELIVFPDDTHETLLHKRWLYLFGRMDEFLKKFLSGN